MTDDSSSRLERLLIIEKNDHSKYHLHQFLMYIVAGRNFWTKFTFTKSNSREKYISLLNQ